APAVRPPEYRAYAGRPYSCRAQEFSTAGNAAGASHEFGRTEYRHRPGIPAAAREYPFFVYGAC
ncbi:hypothetical protein, partial [Streptomyces sp. NPDC002044]|uniref:hypothetical protein n=1 Tax=Streptomyces sp. NPDC002044 TaxID=3154662 RepID=UPI003334210C